MKMCAAFAEQGHAVTLYAPSGNGTTKLEDLQLQYGIRESFDLRLMDPLPGLRLHDFALRTALAASRQPADVVMARHLLSALWTSILGIPTIFDAHAPPGARFARLYLRLMLARPAFKRVVAITSPIVVAYREQFGDLLGADQILLEPNAVDLEQFRDLPTPQADRDALGLATDAFTVGYSGHLYPGRGVDLILELAERLPVAQFVLVGGTESDVVRWQMEASTANVHFVGFVPNRELPTYLAASNVLLMPYQRRVTVHGGVGDTSAYMCPMKMFDYMAAERLIISSDLPVLHDTLNESNAVLCDPEDVNAWEAALRRAMDDPAWAVGLARQARRDVEPHTWQQRAQRILAGLDL